MNSVLIGLTTYNNYKYTYLALKQIEKNTPSLFNGKSRLIIIDNNSIDGTVDNIKRDFPWIKEIIISEKDCISYQWNQFVDLLKENEDFLIIANDLCVGPNWLELLQEDTYRYPEVIVGSPYMPCDLQYDEIINHEFSENFKVLRNDIIKASTSEELELFLNNLYDGDFDQFCIDFAERNKNQPPIDQCITHLMLFKNELFTKYDFRFDEGYCPVYGSMEYQMIADMNNLGLFRIASSRCYVHHFISASATTSTNMPQTEKQKAINKNNLRLLKTLAPIPDSITYLDRPMPSRILNWRSSYYKFKKVDLSDEEARKVPGSRFMTFAGLAPGENYFSQLKSGSVLIKDSKMFIVEMWLGGAGGEGVCISCKSKEKETIYLSEDKFLDEQWSILYYWREEEKEQNQYWKDQFK